MVISFITAIRTEERGCKHNLSGFFFIYLLYCILYFLYICMSQFKIALHLESYWKTKHDEFGFRYLEQVLYLDSLLVKKWFVHTKTFFLYFTQSNYHNGTPYKSIVFILHNQTTIWKSQENDWVNTGVVYFTVCLITEIYQDMSFSFHDADSSKYRNKTNLILKK